ncbi:cytochrome P450 [Ascobolus immersus RN42]|uniref:Cytochrome P450 n=1 Tax=Ascobolus immersus RN42 TaxID=1160509 RepID=A0A3N4HF07_ASCIM|nr:cytochrome P450 [Ascobolus immersus RN42]
MGVIEELLATQLHNFSFSDFAIAVGATFALYRLAIIFYRIYLSPLAKIPGPKLAAATSLYQTYFDIIKNGTFVFHVPQKLHPKYGPTVRVGPNRIRLSDAESFQQIHKIGTKFTKDRDFYLMFGHDYIVNERSNEIHRKRRAPFANSFGPAEVRKQEPLVREKMERLLNKFDELCKDGGEKASVNLDWAIQCMALEVFFQFSFGTEVEKYIDTPGFAHSIISDGEPFMNQNIRSRTFPTFYYCVSPWFPEWFKNLTMDSWMVQIRFKAMGAGLIRDYGKKYLEAKRSGKELTGPDGGPKKYTYLDGLLDRLKEGEELSEQVVYDAVFIFIASFATVASVINQAIVGINRNQSIYKKVMKEIDEAYATEKVQKNGGYIDSDTIQGMSYFQAVYKEALRLAVAASGPLPRVTPPEGATLAGHYFPGGTIVEHAIYTMQTNASVFPDPLVFRPERWLASPKEVAEMDKYMIAFGGGSRICLGQNLGAVQVQVTIVGILRRFDVELSKGLQEKGIEFLDKWGSLLISDFVCTIRPRKV